MSLASQWSTLMAELPPWLHYPAQVFVLATTSTYVASVVTGNASHLDRLWPFLPSIYTIYFTLLPWWPNEQKWILMPYVPEEVTKQSIERYGIDPTKDFSLRALIIVGLVGAWSIRFVDEGLLPFLRLANFSVRQFHNACRKGLYKSYTPSKQWFFAKFNWTPADAQRGFITRGMFAWVRHPNFWCEQEFWWAISFFPFLAAPWFQGFIFPSKTYPPTDPIVFWAIPAPLTYLFMLMGSMVLTERISAKKYSDYKYYQERLGMYMMSYTWRHEIALLFSKRTQEREATIRRALWGKEKTK
ncbi:hypothetical protein VNI00_011421 [Paramarasmius palmivorus]|uniref:Uncharacterized protein n=1 Tax=Paramarasmius palmivorus TaxID=297713 RepID=A0AAW0CEL6_9AGAR